jgi:hypothetical protein
MPKRCALTLFLLCSPFDSGETNKAGGENRSGSERKIGTKKRDTAIEEEEIETGIEIPAHPGSRLTRTSQQFTNIKHIHSIFTGKNLFLADIYCIRKQYWFPNNRRTFL